ncbi:MAG: hypothetical protein RR505_14615 [Raoultibacter sp.]
MLKRMIVDADLCIKLGSSPKYSLLLDFLPLIAEEIFMHSHAYGEVMMPIPAHQQLVSLVNNKKVKVVNETELDAQERAIYDMAFRKLSDVMIDPRKPNKNLGETCSLAFAKARSIPIFATDERKLQPIIDAQLNTGLDDINCLRIVDIIKMTRSGEIVGINRKTAKVIWVLAGKNKEHFDKDIWPL